MLTVLTLYLHHNETKWVQNCEQGLNVLKVFTFDTFAQVRVEYRVNINTSHFCSSKG